MTKSNECEHGSTHFEKIFIDLENDGSLTYETRSLQQSRMWGIMEDMM